MRKRLEEIKEQYQQFATEGTRPTARMVRMDDIDWLIEQAEIAQNAQTVLEELLTVVESHEDTLRDALLIQGLDYDQVRQEGKAFIQSLEAQDD